MNGLLRIRQRYQGLAQSDKKLADYLLLQPDTARHLSSQQLVPTKPESVSPAS
ncbi:RpiR-family transcriptional regulator [Escherichia coli]|nr:RpiR-family transcriptional regulator [Escherichia coli]CAK5459657.1 RpiR-family transcriptional regulator [Escherichia coli]